MEIRWKGDKSLSATAEHLPWSCLGVFTFVNNQLSRDKNMVHAHGDLMRFIESSCIYYGVRVKHSQVSKHSLGEQETTGVWFRLVMERLGVPWGIRCNWGA